MRPAQVLERREIFEGRVVKFEVERVRLPNGSVSDVEIVRHCGAVAVVAIDDQGDVLLVRQYRHAIGEWLLEIPAGKLEVEEDPLECVSRELEEETGFRPGKVESLGWIWATPGFSDEKIHLFLASSLEAGHQSLEEDEVLSVVRMPWRDALSAAREGRISDGKSVCALLRAAVRKPSDLPGSRPSEESSQASRRFDETEKAGTNPAFPERTESARSLAAKNLRR